MDAMNTVLQLEEFASRRQGLADENRILVSLSIKPGEIVTMGGPSGSGKTLLLRAIADLDPSVGRAVLEGKEREEYSGPAWRRGVRFLATESAWWAARVGDHFITPPTDDDLAALRLTSKVFTQEVSGLSTGERQRLALLRGLNPEPRVLLLDEPTASLDYDTTLLLETLVREQAQSLGFGVLWVCHDLAQRVRIADRAFQVSEGRLCELNGQDREWLSSH